MDWDEDLLGAIYESDIASDAVVTTQAGASAELRAIDASEGAGIGSNVEVATLDPAAFLRTSELAQHGLEPRDLLDGTIALNGVVWRIVNTQPRPTPGGEAKGEAMLTLYRDPSLAPATEGDSEEPIE